MKRLNIVLLYFTLLILPFTNGLFGADIKKNTTVLTSLQATYSITSALSRKTSIEVVNARQVSVGLDNYEVYFKTSRKSERRFQEADAVVTIKSVWKKDPLFIYARKSNIRVIQIDASISPDPLLSGVSRLAVPQNALSEGKSFNPGYNESKTSLYIWLSLSNASRMAEIIAADLKRLVPGFRKQIEKNLLSLKKRIFNLKLEFDNKFGHIEDLELLALADEFVYLTSDFSMQTVATLVKTGTAWTENDIRILKRILAENNIRIVIHKWQPAKEIKETIEKAGARLVILNPVDPGLKKGNKLDSEGYLKIMRDNLAKLEKGFEKRIR